MFAWSDVLGKQPFRVIIVVHSTQYVGQGIEF